MKYKPLYHPEFLNQLKKYKNLKKRVEKKIEYILTYPYNSELLTKKKIDLKGKRSARLTKNFRVIFTICEECVNRNFKEFNLKDCGKCCENVEHVIFLTFGPHDSAYSR